MNLPSFRLSIWFWTSPRIFAVLKDVLHILGKELIQPSSLRSDADLILVNLESVTKISEVSGEPRA